MVDMQLVNLVSPEHFGMLITLNPPLVLDLLIAPSHSLIATSQSIISPDLTGLAYATVDF